MQLAPLDQCSFGTVTPGDVYQFGVYAMRSGGTELNSTAGNVQLRGTIQFGRN